MTDKEMDKLADIVALKVIDDLTEKQKEWDKQFSSDVKGLVESGYINIMDEENILLTEITALKQLLSSYEDSERYNEAAVIHDKIKTLEDKLKKL
jgi:hypothetical protein